MTHLHRYWFTFRPNNTLEVNTLLGAGVTAYSIEDAILLVREKMFKGHDPLIESVIADVDVAELDQDHVVPNMAVPTRRGIWFPLGYT